MRTFILTTAALAMAAAAPAFAYSNNGGSSYQPQMNSQGQNFEQNQASQPAQNFMLRRHIEQELSQAGFRNIHVMPESFFVRATDSAGLPVMMVISPHGVTAVTELQGQGQGQSSSNSNSRFGQNSWNGNNQQTSQNNHWNQNGQWNQNSSSQGNGPLGNSGLTNSAHNGSAINSSNGNGSPTHY